MNAQEFNTQEALTELAGKYLTFHLGEEGYGLEILKVQEIIGMQDITKIPRAPDYVKGVINLRGTIIPIVDLRDRFGVSVDGAWVPERVWEQSLAHTLAQSGLRYTVLDDAHFEAAGLRHEDISGYFLTEEQGELLKVFASDENLRYHIPFREPQKTIDYLRGLARNTEHAAVCYGDDGEKFGLWPGTYELCYEEGWLESFMEALRRSGDWLQLKKPSETCSI